MGRLTVERFREANLAGNMDERLARQTLAVRQELGDVDRLEALDNAAKTDPTTWPGPLNSYSFREIYGRRTQAYSTGSIC